MIPDLAHNPQPYRRISARRAALLSRTLRSYAAKVKDKRMAAFLSECGETIDNLQIEVIQMARDFISATDVVVTAYNQKATDNATLATANTALTAQVADLTAKQQTPETIAAQQKVIDLSEQIQPSAPVVDPNAGSNGANVTLPPTT